ncbi:phage holin family protein [Conexibacter woesei]|uniref:phage holin family protein n=1 Tax=Conexibacter woesei TaxID=191495 RepID=UPI0004133B5C|nr:phage holin family protein [Conexibacter woesei]
MPGGLGPRTLFTLLIAAAALLVLGPVIPGYSVESFGDAVILAVIAGLLNAVVWPAVVRFALPLTVLTLGGFVLVMNAAVLLLAAAIAPGVHIDDVWTGIVVAICATLITTVMATVLSIDDDERFASHLALRRRRAADRSEVPGLLLLEIDGLAHDVLQRALRDGNAPTLQRWVDDGSHHLVRWETDWSSQTGACQAGILHGSNEDMPAFRWWEKERGAPIVTNHPRDAAELERRVSDGRGLLFSDGASRANILSGDAPHSLLTMSTVLDVRRGRLGQDYFTYFSSPYNVARTLLLTFYDVGAELLYAAQQRRRDVRPRVHRGFSYAVMRAYATAVQLDLQVESVIGDLEAGRPVIYTTFLAYDEVAHHSGIERADTLAVLRRVDRRIRRLAAAAEARGARPYRVAVLSDHGQTQGATFRDRYGETLEALVQRACGIADEAVAAEASGEDEAAGRLGAALTEAGTGDSAGARAVRIATRAHRTEGGEVRVSQKHPEEEAPAAGEQLPEVSVMASGNLGLITFPRLDGRATRATIEREYPNLIAALRDHAGIGFVVVRDDAGHDVVLGAEGTHDLATGHVDGVDPLAPYGPRAARHVARTAAFPHCPDILVNSAFWEQTAEVAAFEELVGSHGGLGGGQAHPFLLAPATLPLPSEEIVGAAAVHHVLRGWMVDLGHAEYATPAAPDPIPEPVP